MASSAMSFMVTLAVLLSPAAAAAALFTDSFHANSCTQQQVEDIVMTSVQEAMMKEYTLRHQMRLPAGLLRIFFHDCFPNGCDASILLNATSDRETALGPNLTIQPGAMQLIEDTRAKVHAACGPTVSCADITILATRAAVESSDGPTFEVPLGNLDSLAPAPQDKVNELPAPNTASVASLMERFATRGLGDVADLVALSGAHTIGRARCGSFSDRSGRSDDTFSRKLAANCSKYPDRLQNLDTVTPDLFDSGYHLSLMMNKGVFTSDMALVRNRTTKAIVEKFALEKRAFFVQFAKSMTKLANAPKTNGNMMGEIRQFSCFRTNAQHVAVENAGEEEEKGFAASA